MNAVWTTLSKLAKTEDQKTLLLAEFERYRQGYITRYNAWLSARSRTMSVLIAGRSGVPAASNEKKNRVANDRLNELLEWDKKVQQAIADKIEPSEARAISSDNPDAPELLQKKIAEAECLQTAMKAANTIVRKKSLANAGKIEQLQSLGLSETIARKILEPDCIGRVGFPDYALQNNLANIKRMQARLAQITAMRSDTTSETPFDGGTVVDNVEDNRLQIIFDEKPDVAMRDKLKSRGFRWAPSHGAWQRQRGRNAQWAVEHILGVKMTGAKG